MDKASTIGSNLSGSFISVENQSPLSSCSSQERSMDPVRNVCCIGAGYVGGPTAAVVALHNPGIRVTVVDRDQKRIAAWKSRHLPIHEPGLSEIVRATRDGFTTPRATDCDYLRAKEYGHRDQTKVNRAPNLFFSTACASELAIADVILVSVNTPTKMRGVGAGRATDMAAFEGAIREIAEYARPGTIIVEKSTVPCKTGQLIKNTLAAKRPGLVFPVLSNPEFLAEGTAVRDLLNADRVVIGCEQTTTGYRAAAVLGNLYAAWIPRHKIAIIRLESSEICKLAANAMLAQRVSSINSMSAVCEAAGADINEIAWAVGLDSRIGSSFLKAGIGFGGSCFRKDIANLTYSAESLGALETSRYWQAVLDMNESQCTRFAKRVVAKLNNSLRGKKIAILGYAFKKDTGDARESLALNVIRELLEESPSSIAIFDPLCSPADIRREVDVLREGAAPNQHHPIEIVNDPYTACQGGSAILVLTDWDMFKNNASNLQAKRTSSSAIYGIPALDESQKINTKLQGMDIRGLDIVSTGLPTPPDTAPASPKPAFLPEWLVDGLLPQPECPRGCVECAIQQRSRANTAGIRTPLDWSKVADIVREPRWVFDGRGMLDETEMTALGFRLESVGRASKY